MGKADRPESISKNKPLICLHTFAQLVDKYDNKEATLDFILKDLVKIMPKALRYPDIGCVRIVISPVAFSSKGFTSTRWNYTDTIKAFGEVMGTLEVSYKERVSKAYDGPFTADEIMLFSYVSSRTGKIVENLMTRKQLKVESRSLENTNTALNEVLSRTKREQSEVGASIQSNVSKVIVPLLDTLYQRSNEGQKRVLDLIRSSLAHIVSPFTSTLSNKFMTLTPQEILICHLIKNNLSSKEIADMKDLSVATVNTHRENIRRKLELNKQKVNLKSYLINNFEDALKFLPKI